MKKLLGYALVLLIGLGSAYAVGTRGHVVQAAKAACCIAINADKD